MMQKTVFKTAFGVMALSVAVAATSFAHHSASMFDQTKRLEVKGTVKDFRWTNPHSWLVLTPTDASSAMGDFNIEMNGPGYLVRNGWKRESLKPGDTVTVTVAPLKDGSPGGTLIKVITADGKELSATPGGGGAPPAGAPAPATPAAP